jgi:hypothetical protein
MLMNLRRPSVTGQVAELPSRQAVAGQSIVWGETGAAPR